MVSIVFIIAIVVLPISACILAILLFPFAPAFLLKRFSRYLWDLSLPVGKYRCKLVHLMLLITFIMFAAKGNQYNDLLNKSIESPEFELAVDLRMKLNRCGRDFYLMGNHLAIWLYIWRVIPLISQLVK